MRQGIAWLPIFSTLTFVVLYMIEQAHSLDIVVQGPTTPANGFRSRQQLIDFLRRQRMYDMISNGARWVAFLLDYLLKFYYSHVAGLLQGLYHEISLFPDLVKEFHLYMDIFHSIRRAQLYQIAMIILATRGCSTVYLPNLYQKMILGLTVSYLPSEALYFIIFYFILLLTLSSFRCDRPM